jgi:hypothetical protein
MDYMKPLVLAFASLLATMPAHAQSDVCTTKAAPLSQQADAVALVEIEKVGSAPGFWSGQLAAQQRVTYRVVRVLKGQLAATEFSLDYYIVDGSRIVESHNAELKRSLFKVGSRVIVFLRVRSVPRPNGEDSMLFQSLSDDCSVLPASAAVTAAVTQSTAASTAQ